VVTSPQDGVVLRREAAPGAVVGPGAMPRGGDALLDRAMGSVVTLYDPAHLQARVDVLLKDVGAVGAGRRVEVLAESFPGRVFRGVVTRVQSQADPAKGTLQVKVRIEDPASGLAPETIVRARFLAEARPSAEAGAPVRILVPRRALKGDAVFVVDPQGHGRARRVPVRRVADEGDWVEVDGALSATQHAILDDGVEDGQRVKEVAR
jgi:multidrug efflux pump subunit AcrA (membrane-fusion protein)